MAGPASKESVKKPASALPAAGSAVTCVVVRPMLVAPEQERSSEQKAATVAILNVAEVAEVRPGLDATSVYVPGALSARPGNSARPRLVASDAVPPSTANPEPGPRAIVTFAAEPVTRTPAPSTTSTPTAGPGPYGVPVIASPTLAFAGSVA